MPYCPNCGNRVDAVHHYCGSCGQALSEIAASESESPPAIERDGFLSPRSLSYVNELLAGERTLDHESVPYTQLSREVSGAFADFARLAMVRDLDLLHLWAVGVDADALRVSPDEMNTNQFEDWLATVGLGRTLEMYDEALHTEFHDEFSDRIRKLTDVMNDELDDNLSE